MNNTVRAATLGSLKKLYFYWLSEPQLRLLAHQLKTVQQSVHFVHLTLPHLCILHTPVIVNIVAHIVWGFCYL